MLADAGIGYASVIEPGNVFIEFPDWLERYRQLLDVEGKLLITRIVDLPESLCLMCAEKQFSDCHRQVTAARLEKIKGYEVRHL